MTPKTAEYGASSTSFYTCEEKRDHYENVQEILTAKCHNANLASCLMDLLSVCGRISDALRDNLVTVHGNTNDFGDTQLSVDVSVYTEKQ